MSKHAIAIRIRHMVHHSRLLQIGVVAGFWLAGEGVAKAAHLPIPGGIIGMLMVLALLANHRISLFSMRRGAEWFLGDMLLFFVPAVLAVLGHHELFGLLGLKILAVICLGTLTVMIVTAFTVDLCFRWSSSHVPVQPRVD